MLCFFTWSRSSVGILRFGINALLLPITSFTDCYLILVISLLPLFEFIDFAMKETKMFFLIRVSLVTVNILKFLHFSIITCVFHANLYLAVDLVVMRSAANSKWVMRKFRYFSFEISFWCLFKRIKFVSYCYLIFIVYITIAKWEPVVTCAFDFLSLNFA